MAPDILVIGGGVIGMACARALAAQGASVEVLDSGSEPGAATPASAGMLAPFADAKRDDPMLALAIRGRDLHRESAPTLLEETGVDVRLWTGGILHVALTPAEVDRLKADVAWQRQSGLAPDWLEPEDVRESAPGLTRDALGALRAAEDGSLDPGALLKALKLSATAKGAVISSGVRVRALRLEGHRVTGVRTTGEDRSAGAVIVAAGCWSGRLQGLPRPLSVEPVRGQMVALQWPAGEPTSIALRAGMYVVRRGSEAIVGSTMENAGFRSSVTRAAVSQLIQAAGRLYPALADRPALRKWAGLRPGTPDDRPFVGPDPEVRGLWYATGHGRNGIVLSTVTAEIIAALYAGESVDHDITALAPGRFWTDTHAPR